MRFTIILVILTSLATAGWLFLKNDQPANSPTSSKVLPSDPLADYPTLSQDQLKSRNGDKAIWLGEEFQGYQAVAPAFAKLTTTAKEGNVNQPREETFNQPPGDTTLRIPKRVNLTPQTAIYYIDRDKRRVATLGIGMGGGIGAGADGEEKFPVDLKTPFGPARLPSPGQLEKNPEEPALIKISNEEFLSIQGSEELSIQEIIANLERVK